MIQGWEESDHVAKVTLQKAAPKVTCFCKQWRNRSSTLESCCDSGREHDLRMETEAGERLTEEDSPPLTEVMVMD